MREPRSPSAVSRPTILARDALAGVTVALVLIPQSLAYAGVAGVPAVAGLAAAWSLKGRLAPLSSSGLEGEVGVGSQGSVDDVGEPALE